MSRRDDIRFELEWLDIEDEFLAAKAVRNEDPERYAAAKRRMSETRTLYRALREYFAPQPDTVQEA